MQEQCKLSVRPEFNRVNEISMLTVSRYQLQFDDLERARRFIHQLFVLSVLPVPCFEVALSKETHSQCYSRQDT
jgi:hypothetical protein